MSAIDVKNLVKKFHGQTVLHGIDLEVEQGEVVAIIGRAGQAKPRCCAALIYWSSPKAGTIAVGDITIDTGKSINQQKGSIAAPCVSMSASCSRALIFFCTARCWKTLSRPGHRQG
ncbi:hypothetical protein ACNKHS_11620 [Shigella flexneri]